MKTTRSLDANAPSDLWASDSFEDTVAKSLIACFETRVKKSRGAGPDSLNDERARVIRQSGMWIPSNTREIIAPEDLEGTWEFDLVNDALPSSGCLAMPLTGVQNPGMYGGWFRAVHVRKCVGLGKNWHRRGPGQLYELIYAVAQNDYLEGERSFFTVSSTGVVKACEVRLTQTWLGKKTVVSTPQDHLSQIEANASCALQYLADSRYCWSIEAREDKAFVKLGATTEQIKSVLYARDTPLSATGRKRPILHLVEAHKRRLRSGVDVDVSSFLKGVTTVSMGGTEFRVSPPPKLLSELSLRGNRG